MGASRGWGGAMQPTSPAWAAPQGLPKLPCTPAWLGAWAGNIPHHGQGRAAPAHCLLTLKPHAGHALPLVSGKSWAALQTFTCSMETPGQGLQRGVRQRSRTRAKRQGRCLTLGVRQCPPACLQLPAPAAGDGARSRDSKAMPVCSR